MRIGISPGDFTCFGEARYSVLRESGFDCVDFSMVDTESDFYLLSDELLERAIAHERELASEAGVEISQVHGPWRWPAHDAAPEEREERLEKMIRSIRMTARLGCKYWVVHPIMPFGIEEQGSELAPQTRALNLEFMRKLLAVAHEENIVI
jgi:sugar phosphate isomerase/epimerase